MPADLRAGQTFNRRSEIYAASDVCIAGHRFCLLYTSDAADDLLCVDLGGLRLIKKKTNKE